MKFAIVSIPISNSKKREKGKQGKRSDMALINRLNILITSESPNYWCTFAGPPLPKLKRSPKFSMSTNSSFHDLTSKKTKNKKSLSRPNPKGSTGLATSSPWMPPEKEEIFKSMENWARENVVPLLKPVEESWQPQDLLPDPTTDGFHDQVKEIRERAKEIPDDYFVVLVGDMITEEALPSYHARINGTQIYHDQTGIDDTPWAIWARGWSAEENRHGDLLNKYLYLSGRVDMKQIEMTLQYLIGTGMDIGVGNNPYLLTIYTSFQERATFISHRNTAKLANKYGDSNLAQICGVIASDEKRHEAAYTKIAAKLFDVNPNDILLAFADTMRRRISMPAHCMHDGNDNNLFHHFTRVASRIGVYTATDYREIVEHLVAKWNVEKLTGLSSEGRQAQEYVCGLVQKMKRAEEMTRTRAQDGTRIPFSWICNRLV